MKTCFSREAFLSWLWVVLCSIAIFLTIPVGRSIQVFVYKNFGRSLFGYSVLVSISIGFGILLYYLIFRLKIREPSNYIWLFVITVLYVFFTLKLWKIPEEAIHFLEYGLLGFFLFKALSLHIKDKSIYITATLFALFIGTIDEIIQWIIPRRYWDFRDAGLNGLSGLLFQLAIWKIVKPKIISEKINLKSFKKLSLIFAACLILLGLCASNTPERVAAYTTKIPFLAFLQKEETMSEFGYKIKDAEIGQFKSRKSAGELDDIDRIKAEEYAQILNQSANINYDEFIREYNPITNPFLHEMRVHIFRRDTHLNKGRTATNDGEKKEAYFIAYKENIILEKYFGNTLGKSVYAWDEKKKKEAEAWIDRSRSYKSPVSANLITSFSEKTMWSGILGLIALLAGINVFFYLREKRKEASAV